MVLIRCIRSLLERNSHFVVQEFKHTCTTGFTSPCSVPIPKWQMSAAGLTAYSYLSCSVKYSQGQTYLEICWSAIRWAIQSLAPKENCFSSSSWFLLSYYNFSWPAATPCRGITLLSMWCSRSSGNRSPESIFKVIWLLSEVLHFCQRSSTSPSSLTRLSRQPTETAYSCHNNSLTETQNSWIQGAGVQCHMRLNMPWVKDKGY